jgi:hypothetical protein
MNHEALEEALRKRLAIVADHSLRDRDPAAHLGALKSAHRELEARRALLPDDTDARLLHFLERQSYEKALTFLENGGR